MAGDSFNNLQNSNTADVVSLTDTAVVDGTLTVDATTIVATAGNDLTVTTALSNDGTVRVNGSEVVTLTAGQDTDSGTFEYIGDGTGAASVHTIADFGATDYYQPSNQRYIGYKQ